jgi:hypothetical protein
MNAADVMSRPVISVGPTTTSRSDLLRTLVPDDDILASRVDRLLRAYSRQPLYGLDAVLRLHFAHEEEGYFALADHR